MSVTANEIVGTISSSVILMLVSVNITPANTPVIDSDWVPSAKLSSVGSNVKSTYPLTAPAGIVIVKAPTVA